MDVLLQFLYLAHGRENSFLVLHQVQLNNGFPSQNHIVTIDDKSIRTYSTLVGHFLCFTFIDRG
jgi:hypothetical protein